MRYQRELRNTIEDIGRILVPAPGGAQIPLSELAEVEFVRGPMVIKSEDTFLVGYVIFDKKPGHAEVDVVEDASRYLASKIESGELNIPAGVSYSFAGSYESQVRSREETERRAPARARHYFPDFIFPVPSRCDRGIVFSGIFVAWAGGFLMLWLYGQDWFLNCPSRGRLAIDFETI